ncbi:DDE_3 domain-containing protein [Trichonephila clavipes]|nr:DDE_3 domain-containing protein [Trichonephila clavipes]
MLVSRTDLHIFDAGSVNGTRYCNEILLPYVRLFRGAMGLQILFMDYNAPCHRTVAAEQLLESKDIERRLAIDNVQKIPEIIEVDWHVSSRSITQKLKIDHKTVLSHLRKVGFKKKLDVWVPHQLTPKT